MKDVKILWIDDEIDLLKAQIIFLQQKGFAVDTAYNGDEALDLIHSKNYDIIFLDENIPGMSGLEILDKIKVNFPVLPIVMITKSEEENIMDQAIGGKISDYLIKPVNPNQIILTIKKIIDSQRLVSENTTSKYQSVFTQLSMEINDCRSFSDWKDVYKKIIYWETELENLNDASIDEIIKMQKNEANTAFAKYITKNYKSWFDKNPDGTMAVKAGGGTSRNRMHSARDYTGAAICKTIRDEVYNRPDKIRYIEYTAAVELLTNENGEVNGAVLYHLENKQYSVVKAKSVVLSTGGFGRLHIRGYETTNHYGATADGIVMAYRAGAKLLHMDTVQYHPTGAVFPEQIVGFLCTEKIRGLGAQPVNKNGELFVYPLEPRDIEASAFIRECVERGNGVKTPSGLQGIWLDTPLIELINGEGTIEKMLPAMLRQYHRFNIDIRKYPMLVYPTLHYQNGGIEINDRSETNIPGLYVAGEASGGVHGRNRLMGNSQLDIIVFGKRAGLHAAERALQIKDAGKLGYEHVKKYNQEVKALGVPKEKVSPMVLPDYIPDHVKAKLLQSRYNGTLI
jgi:aspartate oxidase/CheY-like chemotaxis protein